MVKKLALGRYNRTLWPACNTFEYRDRMADQLDRLSAALRNRNIKMGKKLDFPDGDPNSTWFWVQVLGDNGKHWDAFGAINIPAKDDEIPGSPGGG